MQYELGLMEHWTRWLQTPPDVQKVGPGKMACMQGSIRASEHQRQETQRNGRRRPGLPHLTLPKCQPCCSPCSCLSISLPGSPSPFVAELDRAGIIRTWLW